MNDAMVTARMPVEKKSAANRVLRSLGLTASQVINDLFGYIVDRGSLPPDLAAAAPASPLSPERVAAARLLMDGICKESRFSTMTDGEIRQERLAARGLGAGARP